MMSKQAAGRTVHASRPASGSKAAPALCKAAACGCASCTSSRRAASIIARAQPESNKAPRQAVKAKATLVASRPTGAVVVDQSNLNQRCAPLARSMGAGRVLVNLAAMRRATEPALDGHHQMARRAADGRRWARSERQ